MTRTEYMHQYSGLSNAERRALHRAYYAQFVNASTVADVARWIGHDVLRASTDEHLNDIPLARWDVVAAWMPLASTFVALGDHRSMAGLVCVAKEAARQWLDSQPVQP